LGCDSKTRARALLVVAPQIPPYGGMALQAHLLTNLLRQDGHAAVFCASNPPLPSWLRWFEQVPGARTLLRAAVLWINLWRALRQAEVVHIFAASWLYFFVAVCPAVIFGKLRGKRVVLNYRGGEAEQFFRSWGWIVQPVCKLASVITVPSRFLAAVIEDHLHLPAVTVPNILDHSSFPFRQRTEFRPRLVVTRQLEKIYDIEAVLKAFHKIQERHTDATLWIAGTGSEEKYLRGVASDLRLNHVRFLGYVAHADLPAIYEQCDILVNASRADNFPGSLLEASAAGLAVVSTGAGGIPFMFESGTNALLVEPGDWEALAAAVERVIQAPAMAQELTRQALALVEACDWKRVRENLYEAYGFAAERREEGIPSLAGAIVRAK
jgi:glycosyltransferase involved in cell wall biosynthesis